VTEPKWLPIAVVRTIQADLIVRFGGLQGERDEGMLESALARPRNRYAYGETDTFRLAAAYSYGLAKNHPFADGNKRIAFMAAYVFLRLNGFTLAADQAEATSVFLDLAAGTLDEPDLASWLKLRSRPS
jgi:death on curing protein